MIKDLDIYKTVCTAFDAHLNSLDEKEKKTFMSKYHNSHEWLNNYLTKTLTKNDKNTVTDYLYGPHTVAEVIKLINFLEKYFPNSKIKYDKLDGSEKCSFFVNHIIIKEIFNDMNILK